MTPPIERRVTLKKAPVNDDVVADLVSHAVAAPAAAGVSESVAAAGPDAAVEPLAAGPAAVDPAEAAKPRAARRAPFKTTVAAAELVEQVAPVGAARLVAAAPAASGGGVAPASVAVVAPAGLVRRGPGRPRSRRRMEPFSSKLEIGLRDMVDEYLGMTGESIVDLLDRALRNEIAQSRLLAEQEQAAAEETPRGR